MSEEQPRRKSRGKQPQSYRLEDEYAYLDEDSSERSGSQSSDQQEDSLEESDAFTPDIQEEEDQEDESDENLENDDDDDNEDDESEIDEESEEEDSDGELRKRRKITSSDITVVEEDSIQDVPAKKMSRRLQPTMVSNSLIPLPTGKRIKVRIATTDKLRTRGVVDFSKIGGQEMRLKDLFGPDSEDLKPVLETRDYWASQETLPLHREGGLRRSFYENKETREKEINMAREWYKNSGREGFLRGQKTSKLNPEEGQLYCNSTETDPLNVLWGALDDPQLCKLKTGSYANISEPWKESKNRRGWLFNLGSRVQEAQWAISESSGTQYLAVAVEQKSYGHQHNPMENPKAPAFSATKSFPASIQIWAFAATKDRELDSSLEPRLQLVICTNWGAPKQFRWCCIEMTETQDTSEELDIIPIGLLAGIWSDGRVRVLDISIPKANMSASEPIYIHYSSAAFDVSIPNTIPTCLHWASGTSIVVATAVGTVAIWTLTRNGTLSSDATISHSSKPWFYQQLADTYILTIASGWPSQPQFLSISIADGFARLYDLRSPNADGTASIRGRTLCMSQVWHEQTQSFAMPDEHYILKHNPIRRYYHNLYTMRSECSITRVASSPVHPGVLIGGTEGNVEAGNPVGRITNYKVIPWQQKWFVHEWRGPVDRLVVNHNTGEDVEMSEGGPVEEAPEQTMSDDATATTSSPMASKVPQSILSQPLVRIVEGYKATQPGIQHSVVSKKPQNPEVGKGITIHEEKSAITVLAWNPSLKFGTWAVAGMASGLLRVEDIGV